MKNWKYGNEQNGSMEMKKSNNGNGRPFSATVGMKLIEISYISREIS